MTTKRKAVPTGSAVKPRCVLWGVSYDAYVAMRDDPRNDPIRMTYHDGVLEVMSPEFRHESGSFRLGMIVCAYAASTGLECEAAGSTTFKKGVPGAREGKGKEPDESFYIRHHEAVRHKNTLDLTVDPPPDLWIEVDNRASSAGKLPIYASFGVPEVWRYRPRRRALWIGRLEGGAYTEVAESRCLPGLTPALLLEFLDEAQKRGQTAWDVWLRAWIAERAAYFLERRAAPGPP